MSFFNNEIKTSSFSVDDTHANVSTITFGHRSGKFLAAGNEDSVVHIYMIGQINSLSKLKLQCETGVLTALKFSNEENFLASGSRSGVIKICDLEKSSVTSLGAHRTCIRSMEYFPSNNNFLATGSVDGTAKLWDPRRQGVIFNYKGHNGAINALKFSPDGRYLLTASDDAAIHMWDVTAGKRIKAFEEHQGPILTIAYHPKEFLFASAGADRRIKIWDLEKFQFICETEMEPFAIQCIAFEPINANYILSGSKDMLHVHSLEPIQLLDTIQMNWQSIVEMMIHNDQLFGASFLDNKVYMSSINLSALKTKRHISPMRDYFPSTPKASSNATSIHSKKFSQSRNEYVESRPSTADSSIMENQTAFERYVPTNHQATPAKIVSQTPSKSTTSQSVAHVDTVVPSRINEQIFTNLSKGHQTINSMQQKRMSNLILLKNLSRTDVPKTNFQAIVALHDLALECFFLRFVNEKLTQSKWNLDLCTLALPAVRDLIDSHYQWYNLVACQVLEKILTNFGKMIYDNIVAKSIGVDLSQQSRREKCQTCHHLLHEIRCLIEERPTDDSLLKQFFDKNLKLFNTYERS